MSHKGFKQSSETIANRVAKTRGVNHWTYGKPRSEETKRKISEAKKGRPSNRKGVKLSAEICKRIGDSKRGIKQSAEHIEKRVSKLRGENNPNYGKKFSFEYRKKLSDAHLGHKPTLETRIKLSEALRGDRSPHWRGGITPINVSIRNTIKYRLWREAVFKRDNYTCLWCGDDTGGNLEADHIKSFSNYPEYRFVLSNGRTLCIPCHKTTDTWGGKTRSKHPSSTKTAKTVLI